MKPAESRFDDYAALASSAAREAGELIRAGFRGGFSVRNKGETDLVTEVDLAAEKAIIAKIRSACPDHRIVAEESPAPPEGPEFTWYVDPLDGTTNFAHGYPQCSVSIALARAGTTVLGAVYDPLRDELFLARRSRGATLNGLSISVSAVRELSGSLLASGFPYNLKHRRFALELAGLFLPRIQGFRRDGSAALNLAWVACGRLDGYWEYSIRPWDIAAGALLVEEAGGLVSGFRGEALDLFGARIVAANRFLGPVLVGVLEEGRMFSPPDEQT